MARNEDRLGLDQEDAFHFIVLSLREEPKGSYSSYGYEFYLRNVMRDYLEANKRTGRSSRRPYGLNDKDCDGKGKPGTSKIVENVPKTCRRDS